jgi:murein DD-endopeptidase MepM/ murein hydrolase activator NlpD
LNNVFRRKMMKFKTRNLFTGIVIFVVSTLSITAFSVTADTPEQRLSQKLLGGNYSVSNGYKPNGTHAGIDFNGTGTGKVAVKSPVSGTIIANTDACGKVAIFDGRNTVILAHMSDRTSLNAGKLINAGDYVGRAAMVLGGGCTATGPHLHVEVRTGKNPSMALPTANNTQTTLNPISYLVG